MGQAQVSEPMGYQLSKYLSIAFSILILFSDGSLSQAYALEVTLTFVNTHKLRKLLAHA